ncbi:MAG: exopolysaccharide biosynthesis protein [Chlamydiota bacterium]
MKAHKNSLRKKIRHLQTSLRNASISIRELLHIFSGSGWALILILFSLPFCQPIQIPGLSTPFGLAIAFIGLRMIFGKHIWLPKKFLAKTIPSHALKKITAKTLKLIKKMRRWVHPRLEWICHYPAMHVVNGFIIFMLGILLALPLPIPLSNLTAAWSILLIALGILENDGLFILIGYAVFLSTLAFFAFTLLGLKHIL